MFFYFGNNESKRTVVQNWGEIMQRFWKKKVKLQFHFKQDQEYLYTRIQRGKWIHGVVTGQGNMDSRVSGESETFSTVWNVSKYGVFLVRIFLHSNWIRRDTKYLSVFTLNAGKYGPEKTPYLDTFHAVLDKQIIVFTQYNIVKKTIIETRIILHSDFPSILLSYYQKSKEGKVKIGSTAIRKQSVLT